MVPLGRWAWRRPFTVKIERDLRPMPLDEALRAVSGARPGTLVITMGEGQWDATLSMAYAAGWILLEVDADEQPVRAYRKAAE